MKGKHHMLKFHPYRATTTCPATMNTAWVPLLLHTLSPRNRRRCRLRSIFEAIPWKESEPTNAQHLKAQLKSRKCRISHFSSNVGIDYYLSHKWEMGQARCRNLLGKRKGKPSLYSKMNHRSLVNWNFPRLHIRATNPVICHDHDLFCHNWTNMVHC